MKTNGTSSKAAFQLGIKTVLLILLLVAGAAGLYRGVKYPRRDSIPPIPTAVQSPMGPAGRREWSKEVVHYPGFRVPKGDREWSHSEIARRHKALLLKELPDYVTELRGCGAIKETSGTDAIWLFVVPKEQMPEFEKYLESLGIPQDGLREDKYVVIPKEYQDWDTRPVPDKPIPFLLFGKSLRAEGEENIMNMHLGKASDTFIYTLINLNNTRATAQIMVGWKSGNVRVYEKPIDPDWEK